MGNGGDLAFLFLIQRRRIGDRPLSQSEDDSLDRPARSTLAEKPCFNAVLGTPSSRLDEGGEAMAVRHALYTFARCVGNLSIVGEANVTNRSRDKQSPVLE